jgi:hypothetical protein
MTVPLFLDVDGVLNVFPYNVHRGKWDDFKTEPVNLHGSTYRLTISRKCCSELIQLPVDIYWLTTWGQAANDKLKKLTGLPELPVLGEMDHLNPRFWKNDLVHKWAEDQSEPLRFVWIDDDAILPAAEHAFPNALLIRTNPQVGVTPEHIDLIKTYLDND